MDTVPANLHPLTSLQIGDVQSYLSQAYLFFAPKSQKFLILVDNHSWRSSKFPRSSHIRELFVTKCRTSPFKNSRALLRSTGLSCNCNTKSSDDERKSTHKLLSIVNAKKWKPPPIFSLSDLYKALHGFIVFEVSLNDIRGINYFNELQSDTSMAFEVRAMEKWEFHSIKQASGCISSWFSGTISETHALHTCLIHLNGKVPYSPRGIQVASKDLSLADVCQKRVLSRDGSFNVREHPLDAIDECPNHQLAEEHRERNKKSSVQKKDIEIESMHYEDTLLRFCFNDRDLPFKFKEMITSDIRLLMLLESGLPSWVIFLQSYPLFCKLYRPWMRPLVRTLYILVSLVTVMIGFYDLYKNVPLLKATASHLFGPLFNWIEGWDMISRVRYLGTIFFLQNLEKTMRWSMRIIHFLQTLLLLVTKPFMGPITEMMELILPIWYLFREVGSVLCNTTVNVLMSLCSLIGDLLEFLLSPLLLLFSYILSLVAFLSPVFSSLGKLCLVPFQACLSSASYIASLLAEVYEFFVDGVLMLLNRVNEAARLAKAAKPSSHEVSMWHSLWKDLFSKVFQSLRSIIYGLAAFMNTCKRHRHSTYNHIMEYIKLVSALVPSVFHDHTSEQGSMQESPHEVASPGQYSVKYLCDNQ